MINVDLSNVKSSSGDYKRLYPTGYVCRIKSAHNVPEKQYLLVQFDVCEGDESGYAQETMDRFGNWPRACTLIRSYKPTALGMLKAFVESLEKSNDGYHWDGDEIKLKGKMFGAVLREQDYVGNDGTTKTRLTVDYTTSIDKIREGAFKVRAKKTLPDSQVPFTQPSGFVEVTDEELPF